MSRFTPYFWPVITGILFAVCLWLWQNQTKLAQATSSPPTGSFAAAVDKAKQSVVSINTTQIVQRNNRLYSSQNKEEIKSSLGSAVIVDDSGYLLTNHHVINGADVIIVTLYDGRQARAKIVGTDQDSDLAVLWIDLNNLTPIKFGNAKNINVGDIVLAIGNPFGFGHTVTQGIISAIDRWGLSPDKYENYLQTDADINVGNSGGALIDTNGELIGINSAIYSQSGGSQGIGLAIPVDIAESIMHELIQQGAVVRGWLGIGVQELNSAVIKQLQLPINHGVIVTGVAPGGPADQAGIMAGDIMTAIDHQTLANGRSGMLQVAMLKPGNTIDIELYRTNQRVTVSAIVGRKPSKAN